MIFNSVAFVLFFTTFFILYWFAFNKNLKLQNLLLLAGCYFFYAWWDWRFLFLMITYSLFNYKLGYYIAKTDNKKTKHYLTLLASWTGIGLLIYFKYSNFFIHSFVSAFAQFNVNLNLGLLNILLPLGISFYTFRTLSYIYDIKNNKLKPTDNWVAFFSFVAFFPCLLAGPIDRAKTLLPQLENKRTFDYKNAAEALRQILCGLFKKIVVADSLALITNNAFDNYTTLKGSALVVAAIYYSIQLYADFSGYSDMAIGFAKLLGFEVTRNFNFPFFSQNVAEFWRKWHISLTSWLTEYVFTPLSITFRDYGKLGLIIAIIINLTVIGIWHGANWTYAVYGLLHGIYFIPLILNGTMNKKKSIDPNKLLPNLKEFGKMLLTFMQVTLSFIIFRASTLSQAFQILKRICSFSLFSFPSGITLRFAPAIIIFLVVEWLQRSKQFPLQIGNLNIYLRTGIYYSILLAVILFGSSQLTQFIYLKF